MHFSWLSSLPAALLLDYLFLAPLAGAFPSPASHLPRQRPAIPPSAASFYVPTVPSLTRNPDSPPLHVYAGHISSDPKAKTSPATDITAQLFFVLTKARRTADKERLIIWFNGGPGCSSFDGLMMEVGPWRFEGKDNLKQKEGGWEEYAHVLYLDQPPGTGFSYTSTGSYLHELSEAADYVVEFLRNWYEVFPEFKNMDTYLTGESYAGQYIPYTADAILNAKKLPIQLKGIAIGNGWVDPLTQYPAYIEFAVKEKLLEKGTPEYTAAQKSLEECDKAMNTTTLTPHIGVCEQLMGKAVDHLQSTVNGKTMCVNVYDIRLSDTYPACGMNWPPDLTYITPYLRRDDVRTALHIPADASAWTECRGSVGSALSAKKSRPAIELVPKILERGVEVMFFNGDQDLICNYVGTENMIAALEWDGQTGFNTSIAPLKWSVNGTAAGEWTTQRNLTYVKIFGASHMVGFDVPHIAHDMILRFMGVDFSVINSHHGSTGAIPSTLGDDAKPIDAVMTPPTSGTGSGTGTPSGTGDGAKGGTTKGDDAMWQSYYNAGSALAILLVIGAILGGIYYLRRRRNAAAGRRTVRFATSTDDLEEESVPLSQSVGGTSSSRDGYAPVDDAANGNGYHDGDYKGKGKARDVEEDGEPRGSAIFDVGDEDDEDDEDTPRRR
ncbi:alpha/beta-hydrolase [Clavulina sp. PMI_390]|nr:alpha/beta-hydrolase [Clavulina sp. PMI_390]